MDDRQLLREYADLGSEQAFKTLVERHLGLVHSAARRQVKDAQLAEDVSQAVFTLLARKAGSLPRESRLSGWLYQTTCFVARRALRSELRRRERERIASAMQPHETSVAHDPWNDLAPHLDEAMGRLGDKDQKALLIRYFEKRTHRDVAEALGIGEEAAKKRTLRALEKLRLLLQRQGVVISGVGLAAALGEHGAEAAPAGLAGVITPTEGVIGATGVAARVPGLVEETLRAWWWTKASWVAGFLAGSAAVVLGVATLVFHREPVPGNGAKNDAPPEMVSLTGRAIPQPASVPPASSRVRPAGEQILLFRVVDDATGNGVASARLALQRVVEGEWIYDLGRTTDAAGFLDLEYSKDTLRLDVGLLENGWVARYATFKPHLGDAIPAEYTLRVARLTASYGGWIRDEGGRPVAGAEIRIAFDNSGDSSIQETPREREGCPIWRALVATTDADGRWSMAVTAPGRLDFSLVARHPDYADGPVMPELSTEDRAPEANASGENRSITVLPRGGQIAGRVLGPDGLPVAGAAVMTGASSVEEQVEKTDADGRFALRRMATGEVEFTVMSAGFAPEVRTVQVHPALAPMDIVLRSGGMLRLLLVDEAGSGVPGAEVILEQWKEHRHRVKWRAFADAAGRVVWDGAPPEGELDLCVRGNGWCYTRNTRVEAGDGEHHIEMRRELRLKGSVIDAETQRPLAEFKVFPGYGTDEHCWERLDTRRGDQGGFEVVFAEKRDPWRVRVEAEGYLPFVSGPIPPGSNQPMEISLQRVQPGMDIGAW
jgi:RNA polymerase sigma factor (sigma-70 family)